MHGDEPSLEAHLATFFEQDYPEYEILFCARSADDAGLETARRVAARYPQIPAKFLSTGGQPDYINAKVASMELMEAAAAHEILVISDSDVRVTPDYLRAVALPFADERVGAMCCPYRGVAARGGRFVGAARGRGHVCGDDLRRAGRRGPWRACSLCSGLPWPSGAKPSGNMGGFRMTADYCADDFVLGNETFKLGQTVVLSHHAIDHMVINSSLWPSLKHQVRWMKSTRFSRPRGHFGTALTFSVPFGLLGGPRRLAGASLVGTGAAGVGRGHAAGAGNCGGRDGGRRPQLVRAAGALPAAGSDGLRLLGSQLLGPADSVAGAGI